MRRLAVSLCVGVVTAGALARPAAAQPREEPLPIFVVDVRGAMPFLGQSPTTAANLGLSPTDLPSRGLGLVAGVQVYPIRRQGWAFGFGGEMLYSRATHETRIDPETVGPITRSRLESLSVQLSLNFGHRDGWSYLSGGAGPLVFDTYHDGLTPDGVRAMTLNYGGGVRWFTRPRLAANFDVRFYATRPADPTPNVGARIRQAVMVISVGVSIR
jgi:hypothetical protein